MSFPNLFNVTLGILVNKYAICFVSGLIACFLGNAASYRQGAR